MTFSITFAGETPDAVFTQIAAFVSQAVHATQVAQRSSQDMMTAAAANQAARPEGFTPNAPPTAAVEVVAKPPRTRRTMGPKPAAPAPEPAPAPAPEPTPEPVAAPTTDLREKALAFMEKHGAPALRAILDKFQVRKVAELKVTDQPLFLAFLLDADEPDATKDDLSDLLDGPVA